MASCLSLCWVFLQSMIALLALARVGSTATSHARQILIYVHGQIFLSARVRQTAINSQPGLSLTDAGRFCGSMTTVPAIRYVLTFRTAGRTMGNIAVAGTVTRRVTNLSHV